MAATPCPSSFPAPIRSPPGSSPWLQSPQVAPSSPPVLPQVHVPLYGQGEDVGEVTPWRAAADQDGQGLDVGQLEELAQPKGGEGHDAELRHQGNGQPLGPPEVRLDLAEFHGAAQREHDGQQHDHQNDAQGPVGGSLAEVVREGEVERGGLVEGLHPPGQQRWKKDWSSRAPLAGLLTPCPAQSLLGAFLNHFPGQGVSGKNVDLSK